MSENQDRIAELWHLRQQVAFLRYRMLPASPAGEELLRAAERVLSEEAAWQYEALSEQQKSAVGCKGSDGV